ncbi:class I SAM-dependent DNA methyltransferase [Hyphococcus sp.]|uniref:class I SAM-dependent DNA methyltransferase n=1 Tax=Hyphococcus sp. TaxID=2038636 RepID=UPI0020827619|nr:MAG: methyltransferase [Marinicaulis sp.]
MRRVMRSSGDLIADRRYQYGLSLAREGDHIAAADLFEQALELAPHWPDAWAALGRARRDAHDPQGAAQAFREALHLDGDDALGASLELSRLDASVEIDAAPLAYVQGLFNSYAKSFDKSLVERLGYATPQQLAAMVTALNVVEPPHFARVLDLGCGTGLAGEAFAANAGWLEGVDLAGAMIDEARAKGVYNDLTCADVLSFLSAAEHQYDLMLAADVFIYLGDLMRVFVAASAKLAPGALFAFSLERAEAGDIELRDTLRFAHSADYVATALKAADLEIASIEQAVLRQDRGVDVQGLLVVALKPLERAEGVPHDAHQDQAALVSKLN